MTLKPLRVAHAIRGRCVVVAERVLVVREALRRAKHEQTKSVPQREAQGVPAGSDDLTKTQDRPPHNWRSLGDARVDTLARSYDWTLHDPPRRSRIVDTARPGRGLTPAGRAGFFKARHRPKSEIRRSSHETRWSGRAPQSVVRLEYAWSSLKRVVPMRVRPCSAGVLRVRTHALVLSHG